MGEPSRVLVMITAARGSAPITLAAMNGATIPTKYLQKAFFPLKGAVMKGVSIVSSDGKMVSLYSIFIQV